MAWWKYIFSILILFHLVMMVIIPNNHSYFQQAWQPLIWNYSNFFNIGYTWQFFSPDPAAAISYRYDAIQEDEIKFSIYYPDENDRPWFRPNYSRRNTIKNIFMKFPQLNQKIFVPYFCQKFSEIEIIDITKIVVLPITFDEVFAGKSLLDKSKVVKEEIGMSGCNRF